MYKKPEEKKLIGVIKNRMGERVCNIYENREGLRWTVYNPKCTLIETENCNRQLAAFGFPIEGISSPEYCEAYSSKVIEELNSMLRAKGM